MNYDATIETLGRPQPVPGLTPAEEDCLRADHLAAPSRDVAVLAAGLIGAAVCCGAVSVLTKSHCQAILCSPFFAGAIVGLFGYRRPVRAAMAILLAAAALAGLRWGAVVVYGVIVLPFVVPVTILGAVLTATLRRFVRGRRAKQLLGIVL